MNTRTYRVGDLCRYMGIHGEEAERGVVHRIVELRATHVVTWSEPVDVLGVGGFSWFGTFAEFQMQFRPV